jgi:hypothetical protein
MACLRHLVALFKILAEAALAARSSTRRRRKFEILGPRSRFFIYVTLRPSTFLCVILILLSVESSVVSTDVLVLILDWSWVGG